MSITQRSIYAFAISFVAAFGGFLFGFDLSVMGAANLYLREQFHLSEAGFGFTTGSATLGCIPMLLEMSGLQDRSLAILQYAVTYGFMGLTTLLCCLLADRVGRRPLWMLASALMAVVTLLAGAVFAFNLGGTVVLAVILLCTVPHGLALGGLPWLMMSEIFPTRIRAKAVAVTTTFLWITIYSGAQLFPLVTGNERHFRSIPGLAIENWAK